MLSKKKEKAISQSVDDIRIEGMKFGALKLSDHPRAKICAIDTTKAEQLEGVVRIFTAADVPGSVLFLHHRLGRIEVGETSVVAVASAPHRGEAFDACRRLIERLKADVPIWKKEFFADGSVWVGAPGECAHEDFSKGS